MIFFAVSLIKFFGTAGLTMLGFMAYQGLCLY